mmetsp:Transcript_2423/g.5083  ORF Transcript_2423/g.5083 Transcript_2423/m.5083 type:complete len:89 (+) Transcript_2423:1913-2179(+)
MLLGDSTNYKSPLIRAFSTVDQSMYVINVSQLIVFPSSSFNSPRIITSNHFEVGRIFHLAVPELAYEVIIRSSEKFTKNFKLTVAFML